MMQHITGAMLVDEGRGPRPAGGGSDRPGRMMLVAVPPELMPPVSFGSALFQRLRVVLNHDDDDMGDLGALNVVGELPQLRAAAALAASSANPLRHSRRLQGELLCDESGRLYEKIGHYVHPVHHLVAGPHGEVLDLVPPSTRRSRGRPPTADAPNDEVIDAEISALDGSSVETNAAASAEPRSQTAPSWRELTPASARPRVVRFGEFKAMLGPQLAHPERLRDAHRLSCRVRVFESARVQRLDTLASEILRGAIGQLLPLTPALAARLEIPELVPPRSAFPKADREPGLIFPGERSVRLELWDDPTASAPPSPQARTITAEDSPAAASVAAPPAPAPEARGPKKTIPDRFLAPWQFAVSRDEAVYDLNMEAARPGLRSLIDRWFGAARSGREFRKWQILLSGKSLDDQLWAVRPPLRGLSNGLVRDWARRTLEAAGYDPDAMLLEWEIFWRRKGAGTRTR